MIWYIAAAALIFVSPLAIGLRGASWLLIVSVAVLAVLTYADGGMPGCFVLFQCSTGEPYEGLVSGFALVLLLFIYLGVALAAPIVLLLRLLR